MNWIADMSELAHGYGWTWSWVHVDLLMSPLRVSATLHLSDTVCMYVCYYVCTYEHAYICMYVKQVASVIICMLHDTVVLLFWPTASSVTSTTTAFTSLHSITVNCTLHLNSTADHCVVKAVGNYGVRRTGT